MYFKNFLPYIHFRLWYEYNLVKSPPLMGAIESISSKNITHGTTCLALLNISLIPLSDSPTHFEINSGPFTLIKLASDSVATAFASIVFPVPEGP